MSPDSRYPNRRSIRYKHYDYALPGAYFVTICTKNRRQILADYVLKAIVTDVWHALPRWFPTIALDEFVVMPNHVHFLVWLGWTDSEKPYLLSENESQAMRVAKASIGYELPDCKTPRMRPTLSEVVGSWKSLSTIVYRRWQQAHKPVQETQIWQRNFYDRIVRSERGLYAIRRYVRTNPRRWDNDPDNPENVFGFCPPASIDDYFDDVIRFSGETQPPT